MTFTPVQKLSIGTGAALALIALFGIIAYFSLTQMIGGERAVATTNANISRIDRLLARTRDAEHAQRTFVATGDSTQIALLNQAQNDVEFALDSLRQATEDNPEQRHNLDALAPMVATRLREVHATVALRQRAGADTAAKVLQVEHAVEARSGLGLLANRMRDLELQVLGERTRVMTSHGQLARQFILFGSLFALVFALVALQPLRPGVAQRLSQRLTGTFKLPPPDLEEERS